MRSQLPALTRRRFLSGVTAGIAAVGLYTWRVEPHWISVVERDMPISNLPATWIGKRLVQISDLHVGPAVDSEYLKAAFQQIARLEPDMTVITGDFMTCEELEQLDAVSDVLRYLKPGPLGCYAILGNHDYGSRWARRDVADQLVRRLGDLNIRTLRNECEVVEGLQLVGLDDVWSNNFQPAAVFPHVDWNEATLTLCHNPDAMDLAEMASCRGWVLSGHTHGGQCKPPFLPPPLLPVKNKMYTSGAFELRNGRRLYINRGLGHLLRVRFNARPEITVFRMIRAETNT